MIPISSCSRLCPIHWSHVLSWEWRCNWSSADRRCSNYIWVINNLIAYKGAAYIRDLTVFGMQYVLYISRDMMALVPSRLWFPDVALFISIRRQNGPDLIPQGHHSENYKSWCHTKFRSLEILQLILQQCSCLPKFWAIWRLLTFPVFIVQEFVSYLHWIFFRILNGPK